MHTSLDSNAITNPSFFEKTFECRRLRHFITEEIPHVVSINYPVDAAMVAGTCEILDAEAGNIKQRLSRAHFTIYAAPSLKIYVQYHQHTLMELVDNLLQYADARQLLEDTDTSGTASICQHLYVILQDLLAFLESNFSDYYNHEVWITPSYSSIQICYFQYRETKSYSVLLRHKLDSHLINLVLEPLRDFIENRTPNRINYSTIAYLKELQEQILAFSHPARTAQAGLYTMLLSLNFNSLDYSLRITTGIKEALLRLYSDTERMNLLYKELQTVQQYDAGHAPLFKDAPSLANQVQTWLETEITLLERKATLQRAAGEAIATDTEKIEIPTSLAELAYGWRLIKMYYRLPYTIEQDIDIITKLFRTQRTGSIAVSTMRKVFGVIPDDRILDSIEAAADAIIKLIRLERRKR